MGACCLIQADRSETYLKILDDVMKSVLKSAEYKALASAEPKYIDDAVSYIPKTVDRGEMFFALNSTLVKERYRVFHGTRLTDMDAASIMNVGLKPLSQTSRVKHLLDRIRVYSVQEGISFDEAKFWHLIDEYENRDRGRIYCSLFRSAHIKEHTHYMDYGSEFEQVIVVHLVGGYHKRLLRHDTKAAIVSWTIDGSKLIDETSLDQVDQRLSEGNHPELARNFLNRWLLWHCGRHHDIPYLSTDYSVVHPTAPAFQDLEIEWFDPKANPKL